MWIAIWVEQTLLGRQTSAGAIDFDGTAFEDDLMIEHGHSEMRRDFSRDPLVLFIGRILGAPAVEDPSLQANGFSLHRA